MPRLYKAITDKAGNISPGAIVTVFLANTATLADLFTDAVGGTPAENPYAVGDDAVINVFVADGVYDISATDSIGSATGRDLGVTLITPGAATGLEYSASFPFGGPYTALVPVPTAGARFDVFYDGIEQQPSNWTYDPVTHICRPSDSNTFVFETMRVKYA